MEYFAISAAIALGVCLVVARNRAKARNANPLLRLFETRLLAACDGNKRTMRRLVKEESERTPGLAPHKLTKRALKRLKAAR